MAKKSSKSKRKNRNRSSRPSRTLTVFGPGITRIKSTATAQVSDNSSNYFVVASRLLTSVDAAYTGFLTWDGRLAGLVNTWSFFRVVSLKVVVNMIVSSDSDANLAIAWSQGLSSPGDFAACVDNEVSAVANAGRGCSITVPRRHLGADRWYNTTQQVVQSYNVGGTTYTNVIPSKEDAQQGVVSVQCPNTTASGVIAYLKITTVVEFKDLI